MVQDDNGSLASAEDAIEVATTPASELFQFYTPEARAIVFDVIFFSRRPNIFTVSALNEKDEKGL